LKSLSFNGATHNYNYNDLNLMTSESLVFDGYIWTLTHQYNAEANKNSTTYPSGRTIYYSPNALGQAQSVGSYASNIDYFENGQLKNMTHGNSCLTIQTLKSFGVPNIQRTSCGGSSLVNNQYSYDGNFNITRWNDLQNTSHDLKFTYDALDRLDTTKKYVISSGGSETQFQAESVPATSIAIGGDYPPPTPPYPGPGPVGSWNVIGDMNYDNMGNITTFRFDGSYINYYYGSDKKLSSTSGSVNYNMAYDSRGNVTSNGNKSFSYNLANQMTYGNGNSYRYDGHNRRVKAIDSTGTRYSFYTSSGQLVFENINGVSQENYYLGSQLVAQQKASVVTYIHSDLLGSTAAKSNRLGNMVSQHRYKPFGQDWGGTKNEIGYTGHKFDTDLGLSYMQARYYDPVIGRFYSNDPLGFRDIHSFNRYAYANNNPYKYTDPTGMCSKLGNEEQCQDSKPWDLNSNDEGAPAKWANIPESENGNPSDGSISCDSNCRYYATTLSLEIDLMKVNMHHRQMEGMQVVVGISASFAGAYGGVTKTLQFVKSDPRVKAAVLEGFSYLSGDIRTISTFFEAESALVLKSLIKSGRWNKPVTRSLLPLKKGDKIIMPKNIVGQ
jgi:RHS repeat-associated protein